MPCAVSVLPVNAMPVGAAVPHQRGADPSVAAAADAALDFGTPASCSSATARAAISGVCSAGFASTALPAASAAVTWPRKIASGKFHGEMQAKMPRPPSCQVLRSPVGPGSSRGYAEMLARARRVIAAEIRRLAQFGDAHRAAPCRLRSRADAAMSSRSASIEIGGAIEDRRAMRPARLVPCAPGLRSGDEGGLDLRTAGIRDGADDAAADRPARGPRDDRPAPGDVDAARRADGGERRRRHGAVGEIEPRGIRAVGIESRAAAGCADWVRRLARAGVARGRPTMSSSCTRASTSPETKLVFAPFSSRRRTR